MTAPLASICANSDINSDIKYLLLDFPAQQRCYQYGRSHQLISPTHNLKVSPLTKLKQARNYHPITDLPNLKKPSRRTLNPLQIRRAQSDPHYHHNLRNAFSKKLTHPHPNAPASVPHSLRTSPPIHKTQTTDALLIHPLRLLLLIPIPKTTMVLLSIPPAAHHNQKGAVNTGTNMLRSTPNRQTMAPENATSG